MFLNSYVTTDRNAFIFDMEHPYQERRFKFVQMKLQRVTYGPVPEAKTFTWWYIEKRIKKSSPQELLHQRRQHLSLYKPRIMNE